MGQLNSFAIGSRVATIRSKRCLCRHIQLSIKIIVIAIAGQSFNSAVSIHGIWPLRCDRLHCQTLSDPEHEVMC